MEQQQLALSSGGKSPQNTNKYFYQDNAFVIKIHKSSYTCVHFEGDF